MLRPVMRNVIRNAAKSVVGTRYAYNMDGIDDRWTLANRAINPDGDIDIEFYSPSNIVNTNCIISQNISATSTAMEFRLLNFTSQLQIVVGGTALVILAGSTGYEAGAKFRVRLVGTALTVWKTALENSDTPIRTLSFTRGTAREPTAITVVGAETSGAIGSYARYFVGIQRDIKINGVLWKMDQRNQTVQSSIPAGNNMTGTNLNPDRWVEIPA